MDRRTKLAIESSIEEYLQPTSRLADEMVAIADNNILILGVGQTVDAQIQNLLAASLLAITRDNALSLAGTKPLSSP
jgi:hypothetical protein